MNNQIKNTLCIGVIAAAGAAAMLSCSDTWDDHYKAGVATGGNAQFANVSTMAAIEEVAPDFAEVIKAVGFDRELESANVYTIWAPTHFDKATWLALAKTDSARVVDRFIKNHMARYYVSLDGQEHENISLMSTKLTTMTADGQFGTATMDPDNSNLACNNGILHLIDSSIDYQYNVFEQIEALYNAETDSISLYSFLSQWDADSLDENKSVSRGVDEMGEKIWVDSVMLRNNTALRNMNALIYREDSNYIALIPSAKAYEERYNLAKDLLKFNPSENVGQEEGRSMNVTDSLQRYYANMFAMNDLFYSANVNEHIEDSLVSTQYSSRNWPNHLYYRHEPTRVVDGETLSALPENKTVNDILATYSSVLECSNGKVYVIDDYPMTPVEQFFYEIDVKATSRTIIGSEEEIDGQNFTRNIGTPVDEEGSYDVPQLNEDGDTIGYTAMPYHFVDIAPRTSSVNIEAAFKIDNTLSGTYDIYIVTCPIYGKDGGFRTGAKKEDDPRPYKFRVTLYERSNNEARESELGKFVSGEGATLQDEAYEQDSESPMDTLFLGSYTFKNAYYGNDRDAGVIIKVQSNVSSGEARRNSYSRDMLISGFILRPKQEAEAVEAKRK